MTSSLVIGGGSIGGRHARLLTELGDDVTMVTAREDIDLPVSRSIADALRVHRPDYVVVATATGTHLESMSQLIDAGYDGRVLVEKPLAIPVEALARGRFERIGVAYNLRFHPVLMALRAAMTGRTAQAVEVYAGQHLSTWRPGRSVADQYSAYRAQGGGVLRDLSHELDYLQYLFGSCVGVFARGGRWGDVTVDSDDAWGIVAEFERAPLLTLQLNYLDTRTRRRIVVNTGDETIDADLVGRRLQIEDEATEFDGGSDESYLAMHLAMRGSGESDAVTTVEEALRTDRLIELIERSAERREWVQA